MKKILITGVAGFIGSNVAESLLFKDYAVIGLDNMSQGEELNLAPLKKYPKFVMCYADIRDEKKLNEAATGCDVVVHLAAYKIPRYTDALDTLHVNAMGSDQVFKAAVKNKAKIVAASTSDVYGKNSKLPFHEESNLVVGNPDVRRWAYAISKMYEEQLLFAYRDRFNIPVVGLRFFGGYGPNQNLTWWGGPQSVFINQALNDEEIEIHGDGSQTRSFTYITDHANGVVRSIEMDEANNQIFNLGNTKEVTIYELAKKIWHLVRGENSTPKIKLVPYSNFGKYEDVLRRVPDISKANKRLGFQPTIDLDEGLIKTIKWQLNRRQELGIKNNFNPVCLA